ncbi:conserved hypothetical protein [Roseovarius sp. EC-HK134]|uniref:DUF6476 family protein n=1 Tax=unclassified Roseovarius TaxID=2614913 RepID=UPI00125AF968|nr:MULTISPECIES: DUF6476 family protein [unclassified Roseovarius]VVS98072.1 conserved hypothetical protein [Roseovarius sp. EC-HK134]VVS98728.1 conserved hypothetical protein [Roseovarius sp. EC-SD190]
MNDNSPPVSPATLKFLARLVTLLTATMVVGLIVIIGLFVTRFWGEDRGALSLPDSLTLPEGTRATAFTQGPDWIAIVTEDNRILIYDRTGSTLRQTVNIETQN